MPITANFTLRPAAYTDAERLYNWRNDPWVIKFSSGQKTVSWFEHLRWFGEVLSQEKKILLFIIEPDMGMVRFDRQGEEAVVSIYLLEQYTGQGVGPRAIKDACRECFETWDVKAIRAVILTQNWISYRAFEKAGFGINKAGFREVEMLLINI